MQQIMQVIRGCFLFVGIAVLAATVPAVMGQDKGQTRQGAALPQPTHADVKYGPHERNVLDFWQAKSDRPAPLAIFIHGGGFVNGDKNVISPAALKQLLEAGISVAAINYRFIKQSPLPAAHEDCARALQFLRSKSRDWNLDKTKVGGFGGSAGAQLVMYLAFHDDLADLKSDDPVKRESTRLVCVAPHGGQVTMDMIWWMKHVPGYKTRTYNFEEMFGVKTEEEALRKNAAITALTLISKDDPPIFMTYRMPPDEPIPTNAEAVRGWMVHHVVNGVELKKVCDTLGVESYLKYPGAKPKYSSGTDFLIAKLKGAKESK